MKAGVLQYYSSVVKLLILFILMLVAMLFVSLIVGGMGLYLYGEINFDPQLLIANVRVLKLLQLLQTVFVFVIPSALAAYLFFPKSLGGIYGDGLVSMKILLVSAFVILVSQYFIGWTGFVNSKMVLPESWTGISEWITNAEDEAIELTNKFTESNVGFGFIVNIIVMAIIPAVGEEWLFRGHIQRYMGSWTGNIHVAVIVTSILFAAMHLQFMTFLPRFFLSIILGYLFYYGRNLWYSIAGHFTNNFLALTMMRTSEANTDGVNPLKLQADIPFSVGVVFSLLSVIALLYLISRKSLLRSFK